VLRGNWDLGFDAVGEGYEHPTRYDVTVTYAGADGHPYGPERYPLDFGVFSGQATGAVGMPELVDAVESLSRKLG
jgi:hypothetical protein